MNLLLIVICCNILKDSMLNVLMRRRRARRDGWPCRCWWKTASRAPEAAPRPACPAPSTAPSRRTRTTSSRTRSTSVSLCRTSTSRAPPTCAPPTCRCRVAPGSASPCPRTPSTWASSGVRRPTGLTTSPRRATSCSHSTSQALKRRPVHSVH